MVEGIRHWHDPALSFEPCRFEAVKLLKTEGFDATISENDQQPVQRSAVDLDPSPLEWLALK